MPICVDASPWNKFSCGLKTIAAHYFKTAAAHPGRGCAAIRDANIGKITVGNVAGALK